ncbi:GNAT family N-acetyltransferase [Alteromonas sp. ASW11-130]|uniref:GNAT family N-acetyltransferase n=1 Tax=Alteromonas sp. ASW11-130 TaxID=3015775 RepID=UPI0022422FBE|nr:N-acetyltransferase [Alteromonas sp. ASW11-130]MCW8091513.1 GNAT family N-acetyltransferase [Alteromonas sp. ASW11-130]
MTPTPFYFLHIHTFMISKLDHSDDVVAEQVYSVFQKSYIIEAELIGVDEFPPLLRSVDKIKDASTLFYGFFERNNLAGVIEVEVDGRRLSIDSLAVHPHFFRRGIADKLISFVTNHFRYTEAVVETAAVNTPAIALYEKHGFQHYKTWTPSHGIEKVALKMPEDVKEK